MKVEYYHLMMVSSICLIATEIFYLIVYGISWLRVIFLALAIFFLLTSIRIRQKEKEAQRELEMLMQAKALIHRRKLARRFNPNGEEYNPSERTDRIEYEEEESDNGE